MDLSRGFKLIFAVCDSPIDQEAVLRSLWRSGRRYRIARVADINRPVFEQVDAQVAAGRVPVMILGLENFAFPGADQVGPIQNLNITRPLWPERFDQPVVVWLTLDSERLITQYAPDFYRFRSASIDIPFPERPGRRRTWELRRRVERVVASPETSMRWWWELGLRTGSQAFSEAIRIACQFELELPKSGARLVKSVYLGGPIQTLRPLLDLPNLRDLGVGDDMGTKLPAAEFSRRALNEFSALSQIEAASLSLGSTERLDVLRAMMVMPRLADLTVYGNGYASSARGGVWHLTPQFFKAIADHDALKRLDVAFCRLTTRGLAHIRRMPLQSMSLYGPDVKPGYVAYLPTCLRTVYLGGEGINDDVLGLFSQFGSLESLALWNNTIHGRGLGQLHAVESLRQLSLVRSALVDEFCAELAEVPWLEDLDLRDTKITDASVSHLGRCTRLRRLDISHTQITAAGVRDLRESLPGCRIETNSSPFGDKFKRRSTRNAPLTRRVTSR